MELLCGCWKIVDRESGLIEPGNLNIQSKIRSLATTHNNLRSTAHILYDTVLY
jgi:hypothetical protein